MYIYIYIYVYIYIYIAERQRVLGICRFFSWQGFASDKQGVVDSRGGLVVEQVIFLNLGSLGHICIITLPLGKFVWTREGTADASSGLGLHAG